MAHFRGTLKGNRGEASRLGTARTGLVVTANGWDFGVKVILREDGHDIADIYLTGGSHAADVPVYLGSYSIDHLKSRKAS